MEEVMDYRAMFDRDYIGSWDLPEGGKDVVVTISKVIAGELTGPGGRKAKKPVLYFEGKEKGMALNKTNGKTIAALYGPKVEEWTGKRIAIYATETSFGGETVPCIRVRPKTPEVPQAP